MERPSRSIRVIPAPRANRHFNPAQRRRAWSLSSRATREDHLVPLRPMALSSLMLGSSPMVLNSLTLASNLMAARPLFASAAAEFHPAAQESPPGGAFESQPSPTSPERRCSADIERARCRRSARARRPEQRGWRRSGDRAAFVASGACSTFRPRGRSRKSRPWIASCTRSRSI